MGGFATPPAHVDTTWTNWSAVVATSIGTLVITYTSDTAAFSNHPLPDILPPPVLLPKAVAQRLTFREFLGSTYHATVDHRARCPWPPYLGIKQHRWRSSALGKRPSSIAPG